LWSVPYEESSVTQPFYLFPQANRQPAPTNQNYANGYDAALWAMDPAEYDPRDMRPR